MKKIITLSFLLILASCNQEKKEVKFIPLTTNSIEAKKAFMEGVYRFDQNEINESRAAYKKAVELDDDFLLAKVYYNSTIPSENRERIIYSYENRDNVSQIEKKIIEANYKMQVYGDFKGAISIFDTLISNNPDIPFLYDIKVRQTPSQEIDIPNCLLVNFNFDLIKTFIPLALLIIFVILPLLKIIPLNIY